MNQNNQNKTTYLKFNHLKKTIMKKHEIAIIKTTIELTEVLYAMNKTKDSSIFSNEMAETLLIMLASNQALLRRLEQYRIEDDNLLTLNRN